MANETDTQLGAEKRGGSPLAAVAVVAIVAAVVCFSFVVVHAINNNPWAKADTILSAIGAVLVIAAAVIWWQPIGKALGSRSVQLQANATLVTLLVCGILILLNVVVERRLGYIKADLTAESFYSLSPQSIQVARSITRDSAVEMFGLVPMDRYTDPRAREIQGKRLEEYGRLNANLTVATIDPLVNPTGQKIARDANLTSLPGVVVRYKGNPERLEAIQGVEEADITRGLLKLLDTSERKVYFLTGHGEAALDKFENDGLSKFKQMLEADRYVIESLDLLREASIPTAASCLVAVWPKYPYKDEELQKLDAWIAGGGRFLACLDPDANTNLGDVLVKYGIEWHGEIVADPRNTWSGQPSYYGSLDYAEHEAVQHHRTFRVPVLFMRSGYFTKGSAGDLDITEIIKTTSGGYAEAEVAPSVAEGAAPAPEPERVNGPLTIMMTASTKDSSASEDEGGDEAEAPEPDEPRIRVAAISDGDFPINLWGDYNPPNLEVASNLVAWLTDNSKVIGIRAKEPFEDLQKRKITIDQKGRRWVFILTFLLPILLVIAAGATVQILRR